MEVVRLEQVTKSLGGVKRVDGVSLAIQPGEVFGLLGPNGAGKTTLINLITGIMRADAGQVRVTGFDPVQDRQQVRRRIGLVPQETSLYPELSAVDNLSFHAALYMPDLRDVNRRIAEVLELVELVDRSKDPVGTYSGGMKRRLAIGRALLHDPDLLLMDEPTLGVDVQGTHRIWEYIKGFGAAGKTVLVTTNSMHEADFLCDRLQIIDHGKQVAMGTPVQLKGQLGADQIVITLKTGSPAPLDLIRKKTGDFRLEQPNRLVFEATEGEKELIRVVTELAGIVEVEGVEMKKPSLDDVFLALTGRSLRD